MVSFPVVGDRVSLRPFSDPDIEAAHRIYSDPQVMQFVAWGKANATVDQTRQMVHQYLASQARFGVAFWAVVDNETNDILGDAGFEVHEEDGEVSLELGYTLAPSSWGRGLATEAAQLCLDAIVIEDGSPKVFAVVDAENFASQRVLQKLGFIFDGEVVAYGRHHLRYRMPN